MPVVASNLGNGSVISKSVNYGREQRERSTNFPLVTNGIFPMRFNTFVRIFCRSDDLLETQEQPELSNTTSLSYKVIPF